MAELKVFLYNLKTVHHRWMVQYLRKRNWVVFYLEPEFRDCKDGVCWMKLYEAELKKGDN